MRIWLFDSLVWSVLRYGVEICGWMEKKKQKGGKLAREISEIGDGSELELPKLYAERGNRKRKIGV